MAAGQGGAIADWAARGRTRRPRGCQPRRVGDPARGASELP